MTVVPFFIHQPFFRQERQHLRQALSAACLAWRGHGGAGLPRPRDGLVSSSIKCFATCCHQILPPFCRCLGASSSRDAMALPAERVTPSVYWLSTCLLYLLPPDFHVPLLCLLKSLLGFRIVRVLLSHEDPCCSPFGRHFEQPLEGTEPTFINSWARLVQSGLPLGASRDSALFHAVLG